MLYLNGLCFQWVFSISWILVHNSGVDSDVHRNGWRIVKAVLMKECGDAKWSNRKR